MVCPALLPSCSAYVANQHWGVCLPAGSSSTTTIINVSQPCAHNGNIKIGGSQPLSIPAYVENVYELLGTADDGHPGDFYLDAAEGALFYIPREGETANSTVGHLPVVESLIIATGVSAVTYSNITFEHATWLHPNTRGFVDIQGGYTINCEVSDPCGNGGAGGPGQAFETPAALQFQQSNHVSFVGCTFQHLGSNGVGFTRGSHNNSVSRCTFVDISASAVAIGTRDNPTNKTTPEKQDLWNTVSDCTISKIAQEYRGHPGLLVGFTRGTTLTHNEIAHVPYSGISVGWGWSAFPHTYDGLNTVTNNHIHHHMQVLGDGGAIYTLGAQGNLPFLNRSSNTSVILPPSVQTGNWIHDGGTHATAVLDHGGIGEGSHGPGGLYTDEGSTNWQLQHNVVQEVLLWLQGCRPGCAWIGPMWYWNNWYDKASANTMNVEARCPLINDVEIIPPAMFPAAALAVQAAAGPRH